MKFCKGDWTHEAFKDVFVHILSVVYQGEDKTKLKVEWYNKGWNGEPWPLRLKETITVRKEDYPKWSKLTNKTGRL